MPDVPFLGEVKMFAGATPPYGWAFCNGQLLSKDANNPLFALIGTAYGGDGVNNFALPNLCSRVPIGQSDSYGLGSAGGTESVTLTVAQLPAHSHAANASGAPGSAPTPQGNYWASPSGFPFSTLPPNAQMNNASTAFTGGGAAHENRVPFVAISYIIALQGIFPQHP